MTTKTDKKEKEVKKGKTLVIVESPTKAKTIAKFLGDEYEIDSSFGHIRDLPKGNLGVDIENNYEPKYVIPTKARKQVNKLKKEAAVARDVILATDEDREGEAIAFHLVEALNLRARQMDGDIKRIVFHEITENAIKEAVANPRSINEHLVDAQQARRILDRLVGYKLSPFLWKKVMRGLSAGRVQSVALRLIVEREQIVRDFKPEEYYTITAEFTFPGIEEKVIFDLFSIAGKSLPKPGISSQEEAKVIVEDIKSAEHKINDLKEKETKRNPLPPFITSTLQQTAVSRFGWSSKKTMVIAQKLYEHGHITYMRTDSVALSKEALVIAANLIKEKFGDKYLPSKARNFTTKSKMAQEAHEAIRPTRPQQEVKLEADEAKLYKLIWQRFIASQMNPAIISNTTAELLSVGKKKYILRTRGQRIVFDGFLAVWPAKVQEVNIPKLDKGLLAKLKEVKAEQHFTEPPARFNEAGLIKTLEENGIGRPSTYASIISVIQERNYVSKNEQKRFEPTEIGETVNKLLVEHFPKIVDVGFTADVEESLDEVALGVTNWRELVKEFYEPFAKRLEKKYEEIKKEDIVPEETTDKKCPKCGKDMVIKRGRFGKFLACTGFPECKHTEKIEGSTDGMGKPKFEPKPIGMKCPECEQGDVVTRCVTRGRARGKIFWGCNKYPDCKYASWKNPLEKSGEDKDTPKE